MINFIKSVEMLCVLIKSDLIFIPRIKIFYSYTIQCKLYVYKKKKMKSFYDTNMFKYAENPL